MVLLSSSDDSKHFKLNWHMLLISTFGNEENPDLFDPSFQNVTFAPSMVKTNNAKVNADAIIDLLGVEYATYYGGGCNDNANDAQAEIRSTFDLIMEKVEGNPDEDIYNLAYINGVKGRPIAFVDPFHWANLAVMSASKGYSGDTENGEHEQVHHWQCMMSMHSLHSDDPPYSQSVMNDVMGSDDAVKIRTWREQQQRWLVTRDMQYGS